MAYNMQPPDELMTQTFLPAMRQLVAYKLRSEGLSQKAISSMLGITQASVSIYLSSGTKRSYGALMGLSIAESDADRYAALLSGAVKVGAPEGVRMLNTVWTDLLGSGSICPAHRSMYPSLSDCDVCIKEYGQRKGARSQTIAEVGEAVKMLEGSAKFVAVMPEVSVNIACSAGEASTPADVIAIPGRIVRVRDRAKAMLPPEAGASFHMSRILLIVRGRFPELRACINLRYDGKMESVVRKSGLRTLSIGTYPRGIGDDPTAKALQRKMKSSHDRFDAVIDEGGSAIEPNLYLFGIGAREVAELALELARAYSAV